MRKARLIAVLVAVPLAAAVGQTAATRKTDPAPKLAPRYSPEKLAKLRQALATQIAVHDRGENAMRAPTPEEAAALAAAPAEPNEAFTLTGGGLALRADVSQMSFVIAETGKDGTVRMIHGTPARIAQDQAKEGGPHAR